MTSESIRDVWFVQEGICERNEHKFFFFSNFQTCCLEVSFKGLLLEKNAHIYNAHKIYSFVFTCLILYFGIKQERLEKSLNTFSLAAKSTSS